MLRPILTATILALCAPVDHLSTDYSIERTLEVRRESSIDITTEVEMIRDGEPVESRFGGGRNYKEEKTVVTRDTVLEHDDDGPTKLRRAFTTVEVSGSSGAGEFTRDIDLPCPFDGVTLELSLDEDGAIVAEQTDGDEVPDEALQDHHLTLALDLLLPDEDAEVGDSWELDAEAVKQLLSLELDEALFGRPEAPEGRGDGERRGGGRGGPGGGSGGPERMLSAAEWTCKAKLESGSVLVDEHECASIEVTIEAEGELEEPEFGRGRDRFEVAPGLASSLAGARVDNEYSIELSGHLYFSLADRRPLSLTLEGTLSSQRSMERERDGSVTEITFSQEGELHYVITVDSFERDADESESSEKD